MSVLHLVAHMARGAMRINDMLATEPLEIEPEVDGVTWWQTDLEAIAPEILQRALDDAERIGDAAAMIRYWDTEWVRALQGARTAVAAGDPVLRGFLGAIRMSEFLRTRCVEVVVHHMDLDDAVGHTLHPDAEALEIVGDVLRGLLGTDLRATGVDDVRFVLIGTGRAELTDDERTYLGPLADKFPLLR